jgi:alpha-tubulin suppressor-like RCC1 family protein
MTRRPWCHALVGAAALLSACGASDNFCISGVPCGPVPSYAEPRPLPVATSLRFEGIGLGNWHSCMLTAAGEAWCWGSNEYGQLGAASAQRCMSDNIDCSSTPLQVSGGIAFASLTADERVTCGLTPEGAAWCWGAGA